MERLAGKVAIVTGAGSGNGRAIARAFAAEGARVVVADVNGDAAESTAALLPAAAGRTAVADVSQEDDARRLVESAIQAFGRLDVLVNNAGVWANGPIDSYTVEQWDRLMAVNVRGVFLCCKYAVPALARGGGSIINIASQAGLRGTAGSALYTASKHAVVGMTKCMAFDHAEQRIRVNAICPGLIDTPMGQAVLQRRGFDTDELRGQYVRRTIPLGRIGAPEDVANAAVHLASDESAWVTGMCYSVDGGAGSAGRREG